MALLPALVELQFNNKIMRNYAYVIISMAMLFTGCSRTTLQSETTKDTLNLDSLSQVKTEKQITTEEEETVAVKTDSNSYSVLYLFDTNKPVDESTGLPPVKSISITGYSSKSEKAANKAVKSKEQVKKNQSVELKKKTTSKSDQTSKTKTETKIPWGFLFFTWLIALICWPFKQFTLQDILKIISKPWKG